MYPVAGQIHNHGPAAAVYAALCFLFAGVNALVLYFFVAGVSGLLEKLTPGKTRKGQPESLPE